MAARTKVSVKGELLSWARERSLIPADELNRRFPDLFSWERGEEQPTLRQLEKYANTTRTPLGFLFLETPPPEKLPIPHFRTFKDKPIDRPSPDLLETVQTMQRRQSWMRDFLVEEKEDPLPFVGSVALGADVVEVSDDIRKVLHLQKDWAQQHTSWADASVALRDSVDDAGILVTRNGVVGNNTWRPLDVEEFRGFVLVDEYAPLVFINGKDYEGAQLFTIAHELAHVWLGLSSVFNLLNLEPFDDESEKFCNRVAAEFLVPESELRVAWEEAKQRDDAFAFLSRRYKVSSIVIARRALDLGFITRERFFKFYQDYRDDQEERRLTKKESKKQGGDFYNNQNVRIGKRFASAVIRAAKEGRVLYRDAFHLTGLYGNTFDEYAKRLGL